ncbi:MAG: benzoate-CoA ligase family protein [Gammaproteobacteria bacterium]|nr:benzoate-CoA ligase family protein [Gammaproteobacteria bacterium]
MSSYAEVDMSGPAPVVSVPRDYNAAKDFIDRHLTEGRGQRVALIDDDGSYTYSELAERVNRAGNALRELGVGMETRVMMCMLDGIAFPSVFWGAIKIGAVPIPINTLLTTEDYGYMLKDSRAAVLVVSDALYPKFEPIVAQQPHLKTVVVAGNTVHGHALLTELMACAKSDLHPAPTTADDIAFWLYSSGSTGVPKGVLHLHSDLVHTAALYGLGVLQMRESDVVMSAAKMFFAYGLGNSMTFPWYVGATSVVIAERPTPDAIMRALKQHQPTIFYGVPTLYGAILSDKGNDREAGSPKLRLCVSAGEALPEGVGKEWEQRFGVEVLDGLGSTEMLHIFLSNRIGDLKYGTSGKAVPGYELKIVDEGDNPLNPGELGELLVKGSSAPLAYWNQRTKSLNTFLGPWTRTGDKYIVDEDGYYHYCGRSDDMLKVSGNWVSPFEVESALSAHDRVLEAAVVGQADEQNLIKPKAFVVLKDSNTGSDALADELRTFVKNRLAPYKYPRWIEFVDSLPKTATGKIQRFKLRST